ncbi:MAG: hypothetical protein II767_09765, partial [Proteobacteria bacterium]|nr:hypothetical protein [Pseudomonadota bacterium]
RRKAQEYWICIPSIFNEVRREKNLFALPYPYSARPKPRVFLGKGRSAEAETPGFPFFETRVN